MQLCGWSVGIVSDFAHETLHALQRNVMDNPAGRGKKGRRYVFISRSIASIAASFVV